MVRMSTVWDRTTQVMQGRLGMLATIAALLSLLPAAVQAGYSSFVLLPAAAAGGVNPVTVGGTVTLLTLLVLLCAVWNGLALVAAASDPRIATAGEAIAIGLRRVPAAIGVFLLLWLALVLLVVPAIVILGVGAFSVGALQAGAFAQGASSGVVLGFLLYALMLLVLLVWLSARLVLLNPVLVNERRGLGTLARSFELTGGMTLRIVGVLILFAVVFLVVAFAAQAVAGIVFRLAFGVGGIAGFLTALVSGAVGAGFAVVLATFTAQLYRLQTGAEAAETFK